MAGNTSVEDWLRSLGLLRYTEAFIDNGYDDLDICKQIGDEDLDAIGVINSKDRKDILTSVTLLRDKGVNAVYFTLEGNETTESVGQTDREKFQREDLISKMKELLAEDNCVLSENLPDAEHDPLDDLAQYYADQLYTYLQDVREVLEYLRDGESNEGSNYDPLPLPVSKEQTKKNINSKLINESRLSKSLNSLETSSVKGKMPKSPKHGIGRIFTSRKKNYVQQPPKICGPTETSVIIASQVKMSDEDRKNLMLKVKHGDITQEEALSNFLSYEATHMPQSSQPEKVDSKQQKKKKGFFNRSSFKRHSSGHSSEALTSNVGMAEKDRMELMSKIKNGEITTEQAWDNFRRFGSKRDSKKSPKLNRRGSRSSKDRDRISASVTHLSSTFYLVDASSEISQSTSNIPSTTAGSTDSSPDSTPGLPRKGDIHSGQADSFEQLHSSGESMDSKGSNNKARHVPAPLQKRSPSPLARTVSAKSSRSPRETRNAQRRSTLSSFGDVSELQGSSPADDRISENSSEENRTTEELPIAPENNSPPIPPKRPPKLPPNKPTLLSHVQNTAPKPKEDPTMVDISPEKENPSSQNRPGYKPKIPERPPISTKPPLLPRPTSLKVHSPGKKDKSTNDCEKKTNIPLVNGTDNENHLAISTKCEVTAEEKVAMRIPPRRPSPLTRLPRNKLSYVGPTLLEMIEEKLTEECIDLAHEPYTVKDGVWGVPMALVDRYSCELHSTLREVTKEMDHIRVEKLNQAHKLATPCDLSTVRFAPDVVGNLTSLTDWLTSLGLPMYVDNLMEAGYDDIHDIPNLSQEHLSYANITNPEHIRRLTRSLENMTPTYGQDAPFGGD